MINERTQMATWQASPLVTTDRVTWKDVSRTLYKITKRSMDVVLSAMLLILLSPLMLITALFIKLDSPGPVLFRQVRGGLNGKPFRIFKFRSMHMDASPELHKKYVARLIKENLTPEQVNGNGNHSLKMENDPRVTRVGKFIRKSSIDELPQLINVLRGDMSMIGPRPDVPYAVEYYQEWHKRRLECLPGLTGWWQVRGRNRVSYDDMIRMDLYYIDHMSFWLDVKIILLTPWGDYLRQRCGVR
ncbi:MAG: sugar transferase, partial [Coriobacteriia bacterium]